MVAGVGAVAQTFAQDGATVPVLAEIEQLRYKTYLQQMQIAQLQAQAAQRDFEVAQSAAVELNKRLQRPGYTIDWQRGIYVAAPPPPPSAER